MDRNFYYRIVDRVAKWRERHLAAIDMLHIVSIFIGMLCGLGAGLLKNLIGWVTGLIFDTFHTDTINPLFLALPIVGILLATLYTTYISKQPLDHGSDRVADDLAKGKPRLSARLIPGPIIGCTITLGLGGSAGGEGPIAYTGAAIGSNVGKAMRLEDDGIAELTGCGAAAAIAGIFMAPIGGVMFALEVLRMKQSLRSVLAIVLSSLTAALTCYIALGCHTDITFVPDVNFDLHFIPHVLLCGAFCGLYSLYYRWMMSHCRTWFGKISNKWIRALSGGVILAILLLLFPSLYGEGYHILRLMMGGEPICIVSYSPLYKLGLNFDVLLLLMAALLLVKPVATSATNDSGGVGGAFTPTFYCGGIAGFLFAAAMNHFFGMDMPCALFAFFGMSAVMAGAVRAPLMAIFIASEMTGMYGFILPLTLCTIGCYLLLACVSAVGGRNKMAAAGNAR